MSDLQFNFSTDTSTTPGRDRSTRELAAPPPKRERSFPGFHSSSHAATPLTNKKPIKKAKLGSSSNTNTLSNTLGTRESNSSLSLSSSSSSQKSYSTPYIKPKLPQVTRKQTTTVFAADRHDATKISQAMFSSSTFESLGLDQKLIEKLENKMGVRKPTLIQYMSLPTLLQGKDVLLKSKTGTGKTLAYLLPILHQLMNERMKVCRSDGTKALIVAPTRELCLQIYNVLNDLSKACIWIVPGIVMGGEKKKGEKSRLRKGVTVLVATPGRLLDHLNTTKAFKVTHLRWLVFDEADRLLDLGFDKDIKEILNLLDERKSYRADARQNVMVSATLNPKVESFVSLTLNEPVSIGFKGDGGLSHESDTPTNLNQYYMEVPSSYRLAALGAFLRMRIREAQRKNSHCKGMVFMSTIAEVEFMSKLFSHTFWPFENFDRVFSSSAKDGSGDDSKPALVNTVLFKLHGDMPQKERTSVYNEFKGAGEGILFCTDVAARGLDIPEVSFILQYDPPEETQEYIHRVGRTGRMGMSGNSFIFLLPSELGYLDVLSKHGINVLSMDLNSTLDTLSDISVIADSNGSKGGSGKSKAPQRRMRSEMPPGMLLQRQFELLLRLDDTLLDLAEKAYLSFVRSYSTYSKDLKGIFHPKKLHLGHVAKSFALKESPKSLGSAGKRKEEKSKKKEEKEGQFSKEYSNHTDRKQVQMKKKAFKKVDMMSEFM